MLGNGWGVQNTVDFHGVPFVSPVIDALREFDLIDRGMDPQSALDWCHNNGYANSGVWVPSSNVVGFPQEYMGLLAGSLWRPSIRRVDGAKMQVNGAKITMRSLAGLWVGACVLGGVAQAQAQTQTGYVEGAHRHFSGNVTTQSYGARRGRRDGLGATPGVRRCGSHPGHRAGDARRERAADRRRPDCRARRQYRHHERAVDETAGVRYPLTMGTKVQPYVLGGAGIARITKDVHFTVAGTDVTSNLTQYGVTLGLISRGRPTI